jgi:hypothetical protein
VLTCGSEPGMRESRIGGWPLAPLLHRQIHGQNGHVDDEAADYRGMFGSDYDGVLAYELQGRHAPGEAWITLDVCSSRTVAVEEALLHRAPSGRAPTEFRVVRLCAGNRRRPGNR